MAASESCGHRSASLASSASRSSTVYRRSEPKPILTQSTTATRSRRTRNNIINNNGLGDVLTVKRLEPLTIEEYENNYRLGKTDLELIDRVFLGSIESNQLRAALWPYLFGLIVHRGRFEKIPPPDSLTNGFHSKLSPKKTSADNDSGDSSDSSGSSSGSSGSSGSISSRKCCSNTINSSSDYVFIEHEANAKRWQELDQLYRSYEAQWKAITRDQEERFTLFRERKALIGRDVIRCDRLHPFYAEQPHNLDLLSSLLMTYMMFDFDIGYVQGMSDLAGPILYIFEGDLVKSFWVFVEVMKLVRRNFEHTQKSIHFQLSCLFELIRITDAKFAKYLEDRESSNCFFAFRAIVCQFKRELMKDELDYYDKCLQLWDTIWCVERRCVLEANLAAINQADIRVNGHQSSTSPRSFSNHHHNNNHHGASWNSIPHYLARFPNPLSRSPLVNGVGSNGYNRTTMAPARDQSQPDTPRHNLTETETFILALCLVMILRERDTILSNRLDGNDIHLHFIEPKLSTDLNGFIQSAINTYMIMKNDLDLTRLTSPRTATDRSLNDDDDHQAYDDDERRPLAATLAPLFNFHTSTTASNYSNSPNHGTSIAASCSSNVLEEFHLASPGSLEGYDFLNDFLIINRVPGR